MPDNHPLFTRLHVKRWLEEINQFILKGQGEIIEVPGKISLVWTDVIFDQQRYIAIKPAGDEEVMINGRRFLANEPEVKKGIIALLQNHR